MNREQPAAGPADSADTTGALSPTARRTFVAGAAVLGGTALLGGAPGASATGQRGPGPVAVRAVLRTPDEQFEGLTDYPFRPNYVTIDANDGAGSRLRVHYVDERPADPAAASGETVLLLHGNPSWSYLYRHVIPPLVAAGHRCVAVDLVGFGKSDKLANRFAYTYDSHLDWLRHIVFDRLGLRDVTMVCHDWGGLLGLLLLAAHPNRFRRVVASNTGLEEGGKDLGPGWQYLATWLQYTQRTEHFKPGDVVQDFTATDLTPEITAAYDAPFPTDPHLHGVRRWAVLIPVTADDEANPVIRDAWRRLEKLRIPFMCLFGELDHVTRGDHTALSSRIPGARGMPHTVLAGAAHFLQEDQAPQFAAAVDDFIRYTAKHNG
ncbi:haloalkane dehalogenase [Streptomyces sp. B5E4]|uniref:haloalkane dehalogenase n=1 Tax=Streptomyces sp. B5E4 TaxID=3153568 RepID=UPI00325D0BE9